MGEPIRRPGGRRELVARRIAQRHQEAGWRVWADAEGWRRPDPIPGERYLYVPVVYAEAGRVRRVAAVGDDGSDRRSRALANTVADWGDRGSFAVVRPAPTGAIAAIDRVIVAASPPENDPLECWTEERADAMTL